MVNIFAFFTGKKKSKRASWSEPSTQAQASAAQLVGSSSATGTSIPPAQQLVRRQTSRFLSLRTRSSSKMIDSPEDALHRQSSTGSMRRKAARKDSVSTVLPKFGFEEGGKGGEGGESLAGQLGISGSTLGLESLSGPPKLGLEEVAVVDAVELSVDEVKSCWDLFGKALRDTGCDTVGLMLPQHQDPDPSTVHYLLALYILHHQPSLASSFPSITSYTASRDPKPLYSDLLQSALNDRPHPHELCDILKFSLQHLTPSQSPLLDSGMYVKFVQAEHAASYPIDGYTSLFLPRLPLGVGACLDSVFEVLSDIASKSEDNMMSGGKVCLLLGWWLCGDRKASASLGWEKVYQEWQDAGLKLEHLFYAWIRSQSTKATLPTRLMELVEVYPFGDSTLSSEHLPSPPPSSFPRHTLKIHLEVETKLDGSASPLDILESALQGTSGTETPRFAKLRVLATAKEDSKAYFDHVISLESQAFMRRFPRSESRGVDLTSSSRQTSDTGAHPQLTPLLELSEEVATLANGHPRLGSGKEYPMSSDMPKADWDDFQKTGFGSAPEVLTKLDLGLSPSDRPLPKSTSSLAIDQAPSTSKPKPSITEPKHSLKAVREERIDIDDAFLPFIEEMQLNTTTSIFRNIALVRLAANTAAELSEESPIEWILLVVEHKPPPAPVAIAPPAPRSWSPSKESTMSKKRFSLGGFTSTFRRSSSGLKEEEGLKAGRKSIGGGTTRISMGQGGRGLGSLPEDAGGLGDPTENQSDAFRVGEMGELIAIPNKPAEPQSIDGSNVSLDKPTERPAEETATSSTAAALFDGTTTSDWHYIAEGGANLVFGYHGPSNKFRNKALRIPKTPAQDISAGPSEYEVSESWRQDLLLRLLSKKYLPVTEAVSLDASWVERLLQESHSARPETRIETHPEPSPSTQTVQATLMTDLRGGSSGPDVKVLAIEVKPKWGFTPSPEYIHPSEAATIKSTISRYRLHQHMRGVETSFDPLDLYSGDEARMESAVSALWGLWESSAGKSNNWRVFVDGKAFGPEDSASIPGNGEGTAAARTMALLLPVLRTSGVMERLKNLQSSLDGTDISHLAQRFAVGHPGADLFDPTVITEPTIQELESVIEFYLADPTSFASDKRSLRDALIAYALSATFKDCSVFITCPLVKVGDVWEVREQEAMVKVIDLDLKPISNMKKWYELDEKIWRYWKDTHEHEPSTPAQATRGPIPFRLNSASTEALYIPTPDRQLHDPMDSLDPTLGSGPSSGRGIKAVSDVTTDSTRAMYNTTLDDSGTATPVGSGVDTPKTTIQYANASTPNALSLADALALSPTRAMTFAEENREPRGTFSANLSDHSTPPTAVNEGSLVESSVRSSEDTVGDLRPSTPPRESRSAGPSPSPGLIEAISTEDSDVHKNNTVGEVKSAAGADTPAQSLEATSTEEWDVEMNDAVSEVKSAVIADTPSQFLEASKVEIDEGVAKPVDGVLVFNDPPSEPSSTNFSTTSEEVSGIPESASTMAPVLDSAPYSNVGQTPRVESSVSHGAEEYRHQSPPQDSADLPGIPQEHIVSDTTKFLPGPSDTELVFEGEQSDMHDSIETASLPASNAISASTDRAAFPQHSTADPEDHDSDVPITPSAEEQQHVRSVLAGIQEEETSTPHLEAAQDAAVDSSSTSAEEQPHPELVPAGDAMEERSSPVSIQPNDATADLPPIALADDQQRVRAILAGVADEGTPEATSAVAQDTTTESPVTTSVTEEQQHTPSALARTEEEEKTSVPEMNQPSSDDQQRVRAILAGVEEERTPTLISGPTSEPTGDLLHIASTGSQQHDSATNTTDEPSTTAPLDDQQDVQSLLSGRAEQGTHSSNPIPEATASVHEGSTASSAHDQQHFRAILAGIAEPEGYPPPTTETPVIHSTDEVDDTQSPSPDDNLSPATMTDTPFFTPMMMGSETEPTYPIPAPGAAGTQPSCDPANHDYDDLKQSDDAKPSDMVPDVPSLPDSHADQDPSIDRLEHEKHTIHD